MAKVVTNLPEFNRQVKAFAKANPTRVLVIQQKLMLDAFERLVSYTPRKLGYLAWNWQPTPGKPADEAIGELGKRYPRPGTDRAVRVNAVLKPFEKSWITNNAVYAVRINDGWASYAGAQMLERTVNDLLFSNFGITS